MRAHRRDWDDFRTGEGYLVPRGMVYERHSEGFAGKMACDFKPKWHERMKHLLISMNILHVGPPGAFKRHWRYSQYIDFVSHFFIGAQGP